VQQELQILLQERSIDDKCMVYYDCYKFNSRF
jgi:hypothetical protein